MTEYAETSILQAPGDIDRRLAELGLRREGLVHAVHAALVERDNATELHPSNAAGTFAYHYGIAALRREFVGGDWAIDRHEGIESIRNDALGHKVSFCNVDEACGGDHPRPRSDKGAGAERASV